MFKLITAMLLSWVVMFYLLQYSNSNTIKHDGEIYIRGTDVLKIIGIISVVTTISYYGLGLLK